MASTACTPPVPAPDDAVGLRERARGALLGLAVGDALGAPAENLKPSEIRARWGRITGYVADIPSGTDDTEYAIFSGLLLARHGSALTPGHVEAAWHEWIADLAEGPFRGAGFSERGTLENLRRGLAAPISAQHRHAWSDGLAMRAAPFGVFAAGRPAEAARLVAIDGSVSHEGEGIYGGQAVAAGVAAAMTGAPVPVVIASALAVIPEDSWTARSLRRAVAVAHRGERAVRSAVVIGGYPWTDLAPEAVALAFGAYAAADGDFVEAVLTAVNMGRDADTTAALAGALSGAAHGISAIPPAWASAIGPARGRCLPSMAGHHVLDVAELLVPEEGGKWGMRVVLPGAVPEGTRAEVVRAQVPVTVPDGVPVKVPDGVPADVPEAVPADVPEAVPAEVPGTASAKAPDAVQEAAPVEVPEAVSAEVPGPASAKAPDAVREAVPVEVPEAVRDAAPGAARKGVPGAPAEPAASLPPAPEPGDPPAPFPTGPEPDDRPPPFPPGSQPAKSDDVAGKRGSSGRSPLVGAGNSGHPDGEGQS